MIHHQLPDVGVKLPSDDSKPQPLSLPSFGPDTMKWRFAVPTTVVKPTEFGDGLLLEQEKTGKYYKIK